MLESISAAYLFPKDCELRVLTIVYHSGPSCNILLWFEELLKIVNVRLPKRIRLNIVILTTLLTKPTLLEQSNLKHRFKEKLVD